MALTQVCSLHSNKIISSLRLCCRVLPGPSFPAVKLSEVAIEVHALPRLRRRKRTTRDCSGLNHMLL